MPRQEWLARFCRLPCARCVTGSEAIVTDRSGLSSAGCYMPHPGMVGAESSAVVLNFRAGSARRFVGAALCTMHVHFLLCWTATAQGTADQHASSQGMANAACLGGPLAVHWPSCQSCICASSMDHRCKLPPMVFVLSLYVGGAVLPLLGPDAPLPLHLGTPGLGLSFSLRCRPSRGP